MTQEAYEAAPSDARDPLLPRVVHWGSQLLPDGTVEDGARWALSGVYDRLFGDLLGPLLLDQATNIERRVNGTWEPHVVA